LRQNADMLVVSLWGVIAILAQVHPAIAGETAKESKALPGKEADTGDLPLFADPEAGYSMRIPSGYTKLTQDENREVFKNISEYFGKDVSEQVLRQPPVYFKGPADPAKPKALPPSMEVSCAGAPLIVDPAQKAKYQEMLEESYRKSGVRHGDISLDFVRVSGVTALRAEHDLYSAVDNSRNRLIRVLVPGPDRRYDIVFNFSPFQAEAVEQALNVVLKTFKITEREALDPEAKTKWGRVALWTVGGFITGILLSLILKLVSGATRKPESAEQGKQ